VGIPAAAPARGHPPPPPGSLRVVLDGTVIARTRRGFRVLETSHPPNYYFPPDDIADGALTRSRGASFCEFKGQAHYFDVRSGDRVERDAAWGYADPSAGFEPIREYVAFYPGRMDACFVDDELVLAQPGGFYGGWITADVVGPFKGGPGTQGW
jgi:uncharacterized protein (DUF427 family)